MLRRARGSVILAGASMLLCASARAQDQDDARIRQLGARLESADIAERDATLAELEAFGDRARDEIARALEQRQAAALEHIRTSVNRPPIEAIADCRRRVDEARLELRAAIEGFQTREADSRTAVQRAVEELERR